MALVIGAIPTFFAGPLIGIMADRFGAESVTAPCLLAMIPWPILMMLHNSLAGFIVYFTCFSTTTYRDLADTADPNHSLLSELYSQLGRM
jgi:nitrate/nitrite transporter NarK